MARNEHTPTGYTPTICNFSRPLSTNPSSTCLDTPFVRGHVSSTATSPTLGFPSADPQSRPKAKRPSPLYMEPSVVCFDSESQACSPTSTARLVPFRKPHLVTTPPPTYRPGDARRSRFLSRVARFSRVCSVDFRGSALREKAGYLDLLALLRAHGLRDLERSDWRRLNELSEPAEQDAFLKLVKEGWDFSGYHSTLFSSLVAVAELAGEGRGEMFLARTEDAWREGAGLAKRTVEERRAKRRAAIEGTFLTAPGVADVKTSDELADDLFGGRRFTLNLDEVLGKSESREEMEMMKKTRKGNWRVEMWKGKRGVWLKVAVAFALVAFFLLLITLSLSNAGGCLHDSCEHHSMGAKTADAMRESRETGGVFG